MAKVFFRRCCLANLLISIVGMIYLYPEEMNTIPFGNLIFTSLLLLGILSLYLYFILSGCSDALDTIDKFFTWINKPRWTKHR